MLLLLSFSDSLKAFPMKRQKGKVEGSVAKWAWDTVHFSTFSLLEDNKYDSANRRWRPRILLYCRTTNTSVRKCGFLNKSSILTSLNQFSQTAFVDLDECDITYRIVKNVKTQLNNCLCLVDLVIHLWKKQFLGETMLLMMVITNHTKAFVNYHPGIRTNLSIFWTKEGG